jgi:hypothetical protein
MRLIVLLIFIAVSLGSCTTLSQSDVSDSQPTVSATKTNSTINQITPSETAVVTPTMNSVEVEIFDLSNSVTELSSLDLGPATRLLVYDPESDQILSISDESIEPVPNIRSGANILRNGIKLSPDHRWFAYLEISDGFTIWISSVDGSQHFAGIRNAVGSSFRWITDNRITVYNKAGFWSDCPSEMQIFDPFSGDVKNIPYITTQGSQYCFPIPYLNPDLSQALYLNSQTGWEIYNYKTQTANSVLPGMDTSPSGNKSYFHWGKDGLSFAVPDSDKITFAFDIPETRFTSETNVNTISLPNGTVNENTIFSFWIPEKQIAGLDLAGAGDTTVLGCDIPETFAIVNLATRDLDYYCLNRSFFNDKLGSAWFVYSSADSRFVGWTVRELPSNDEPIGSVILDIETGKVSYLEGYEFLGFGEVSS